MAKLYTWTEMKTKILNDLDLVGEDFVTPAELLGYANEAIDEAEQEILTLGMADYFRTSQVLPLVADQASYALPTDVWGNKIRKIFYNLNDTKRYEIRKIKNIDRINSIFPATSDFVWDLDNSLAVGPQITFYPTPASSEPTSVTIWYIRNAREIVLDADIIDVPEAAKFIIQHIKLRVYEKEGHPNQDKALSDLARERKLLVDTLTNMIDDENNELLGDFSHYEYFDDTYNYYGRNYNSGSSS